ncbi:MAG: universal stress protein [Alphaproteobacteria bacterium]|nr:universal stress protein [Alphaproteobacteria bacterium]
MKTILTFAWSADDVTAFDVAADLGRIFSSHVTGLGPPSFRASSVAWAEVGIGAPFVLPPSDDEDEKRRSEALQAAFRDRMMAAGIGANSAWREQPTSVPFAIGMSGRTADLIVVPQPGALPKMPESAFEDALFESGRPVLVSPQGQRGNIGKRIVIAWNASTESARTTALSMPFLRRAEAIEVISVEGAMVEGPSGTELAEALRRHGLPVTARHHLPGTKAAGQALADEAVAWGADLIVKGAYTQSRLRQLIFGGVTRHLILASPIPVLFSH